MSSAIYGGGLNHIVLSTALRVDFSSPGKKQDVSYKV
jgi:hypothetical protein